jgi:Protein of unknown function (DUF2911)
MKKLLSILAFTFLSGIAANAQVKTPQPSPAAEVHQTVGLTKFEIVYSRPGARERAIFGDLVPFGKVWRTGANKAVQFGVSTAVTIGGKELKAGNYALFTVPNKDSWDIIWYEETEIWGTPENWVDSLEACRVSVKTSSLPNMVESFTMEFTDVSDGEYGMLNISWEKTMVSVKIEVPTEDITMKSIESTLAGPSSGDYYKAASYYLSAGKDMKVALEWISKACEMRGEEAYWYYRKKSLIEAELGMFKEAIATAEISLKNAKAQENNDYVKMNEDSIAEWKKK